MVWEEVLQTRKANPYPEYLCQWDQNPIPCMLVVAHWFSQRIVLPGGFSVGLYCWRLGFRKWTVHVVELIHNLHHCCLGHFDLWALWARTEMPGKEANWHPENKSLYLPDYENSSLLQLLLSGPWDAGLHILWPFREVQPHTSSPECLVNRFLIVPSHVPDQPAELLWGAHEGSWNTLCFWICLKLCIIKALKNSDENYRRPPLTKCT